MHKNIKSQNIVNLHHEKNIKVDIKKSFIPSPSCVYISHSRPRSIQFNFWCWIKI